MSRVCDELLWGTFQIWENKTTTYEGLISREETQIYSTVFGYILRTDLK